VPPALLRWVRASAHSVPCPAADADLRSTREAGVLLLRPAPARWGRAAGEGSGALVRLYAHAWLSGNGDAVCRTGLDIRPGSHGCAGRLRGAVTRARRRQAARWRWRSGWSWPTAACAAA